MSARNGGNLHPRRAQVPPGVPATDRIVEIGGRPDAKAEGQASGDFLCVSSATGWKLSGWMQGSPFLILVISVISATLSRDLKPTCSQGVAFEARQ